MLKNSSLFVKTGKTGCFVRSRGISGVWEIGNATASRVIGVYPELSVDAERLYCFPSLINQTKYLGSLPLARFCRIYNIT